MEDQKMLSTRIIQCVSASRWGLSSSEIAGQVELTIRALQPAIRALEASGYVESEITGFRSVYKLTALGRQVAEARAIGASNVAA